MGSPNLEENKNLLKEFVEKMAAFKEAHASLFPYYFQDYEAISLHLLHITSISSDELFELLKKVKRMESTIDQATQGQEILERRDWEETVLESYNYKVGEYLRKRSKGDKTAEEPGGRPSLTDKEYEQYLDKLDQAKNRFLPILRSNEFADLKLLAKKLEKAVQRERDYEAEQRPKELNDNARNKPRF